MAYAILTGATITLATVVALSFFKAYRRTQDRLFLLFGIAFVVMAGERLVLAIIARPEADDPLAYIPRIVAFGTILFAIVDRNRR